MTGHLIDLSFSRDKKCRITIELDQDFRHGFDKLSDELVDVTIKKYRKRRSISANAYFHVLVNKIAAERMCSDDEVKHDLVLEYGTMARDAAGKVIGFKLPDPVDASDLYPYTKRFDTRVEGGVTFGCYLVYKQTRMMDTKEMAHLIDGAIQEARELGIETDTPEQLARLQAQWADYERRNSSG